ncbi:hypothetical protein RRG08_061232 [Elysia crispata]|uniref:Uncharacterized protein n=1 Tax=Elysia crispata TaxID=231223 RepID=A0AAE0ZG06_9GAST|nr:hypothetical protein RRG08_061232 [Elysia crispata]
MFGRIMGHFSRKPRHKPSSRRRSSPCGHYYSPYVVLNWGLPGPGSRFQDRRAQQIRAQLLHNKGGMGLGTVSLISPSPLSPAFRSGLHPTSGNCQG